MKLKIKTFDDFVPDLYEDYTNVPCIVEDDKALQPAVALQQALANYGPAKIFAGYTAPQYSDDIPVTEYRPDFQTFAEQVRNVRGQQAKSALTDEEQGVETLSVEPSSSKSLASEPVNSGTNEPVS